MSTTPMLERCMECGADANVRNTEHGMYVFCHKCGSIYYGYRNQVTNYNQSSTLRLLVKTDKALTP